MFSHYLFLIVFLQEILEEVFRELHKVRDEIIDGMFSSVQTALDG